MKAFKEEKLRQDELPPEVKKEIFQGQVKLLFRNAPLGLMASLVNGAILVAVEWSVTPSHHLLLWYGVLIFVTAARFFLFLRFSRADTPIEPALWEQRFFYGTGLSGFVWGTAGLLLFPPQEVIHQAFLAFVLAGMAAGGTAAYSAVLRVYLAFLIPLLAPFALRCLLMGSYLYMAMGGMTMIFLSFMGIIGKNFHDSTYLSFLMHCEMKNLNEALKREIESKERAQGEIQRYQMHLEQMVEEKTAQLTEEIRERKHAQEEIARFARYFRDLIENSHDIIVTLDDAGRITFISSSVSRLLGYSPEEVLRKNVFDYIHPEQRKEAREAFQRIMESEGKSATLELNVRHRDGHFLPHEVIGKAVRTEGQEPIVIVNSRDIAERKKYEDALEKAKRLEALGFLAGGIAHDFNNILAGLMGQMELAQLYLDQREKLTSCLDNALKAIEKARELANRLLTFSVGGEPIKKPLNLVELVQKTLALTLADSPVKFEFSFPDEAWQIEGDEGQLTQAIQNIITNAKEAMPQGGTLRVTLKNLLHYSNSVFGITDQSFVLLSLSDEGPGIPEEDLGKLFSPFFTTKKMGSGLGLAAANSIVRRHGGFITVESKPSKGSTFSLYLPAKEEGEVTVLQKVEIRPSVKRRVLVMDDEAMVRDVLGEFLQLLDYEVTLVENGKQALQNYREALAEKNPYFAVILDVNVPGGWGGKETLEELRKIDPQVKAIVTTGYAHDTVVTDYQRYGFQGALSKPFTLQEIREVLNKLG